MVVGNLNQVVKKKYIYIYTYFKFNKGENLNTDNYKNIVIGTGAR